MLEYILVNLNFIATLAPNHPNFCRGAKFVLGGYCSGFPYSGFASKIMNQTRKTYSNPSPHHFPSMLSYEIPSNGLDFILFLFFFFLGFFLTPLQNVPDPKWIVGNVC